MDENRFNRINNNARGGLGRVGRHVTTLRKIIKQLETELKKANRKIKKLEALND